MIARLVTCLAFAAPLALATRTARAEERPTLAGAASFGLPSGSVLVHYATTGIDAVPPADADADGVPDFVAEVASAAELALGRYTSLGFRRPVSDGLLGGDGRIDVYLRDLNSADGHAGIDSCTAAGTCSGFATAENDYAGYSYPSVTEAIRSVVPHELFHLVQYAYARGQPATWTEGTAVWAVEQLYGDQNSDFERFLPAFLTRTYRPFERPIGGFGDAYPYGAALWPYFLERRFGVDTIVAAWTASGQSAFLEAIDGVLAARESSLEAAWIEFTRWNAFTGARATTAGPYPDADARAWREAPREPSVQAGGTIYVEGLSARYVPLALADRARVMVTATGGIRVAAWIIADGRPLADGVALVPEGASLETTTDAGSYTLVVTGLSRGTITTAVELAITEPVEPEEPDDPDSGGCSAAPSSSSGALLVLAALWRRRRRRC